jgi:3' terminal RNA ribose 2'-O-methyltransferase Hen1
MLLTIRTTHAPATDLGYLLGKNPARAQSFDLGFGTAHVFYPEATHEACTAALQLKVDPVGLVRGRGDGDGGTLDEYVNDRPYAASSFLSVALSRVLRSAMSGVSRERPELAATAIPLEARITVVPVRGGAAVLRRLFEPLGYEVDAEAHPLDPSHPEWGDSRYLTVTLRATVRLAALLTHLYVLIPVLDGAKHYFVGDEEVEKLLRHGEGWLAAHPERTMIASRYLKRRRSLVDQALARLVEPGPEAADDGAAPDEPTLAAVRDAEEGALEARISLHQQRLETVMQALRESGAARVLDLGCGEGKLLRMLLAEPRFTEIVGMDVSHRVLEVAADRLKLDRQPPHDRDRVRLIHGALTYRDRRLSGYDAAAVVEVIEHLDAPRLAALERVLWEHARPETVVVTTPNAEYNVRWPTLPAGRFRHKDHRFEWTRAEFAEWAEGVCARFGYTVRLLPVGPVDEEVGAPTQMAVFTRAGSSAAEDVSQESGDG